MPPAVHQRVLLKLSGESLAAEGQQGYDSDKARRLAGEIAAIKDLGVQLTLVIGGGNLLRGRQASGLGLPSVEADRLGMLATVMNALFFAAHLHEAGLDTCVLCATPMPGYAETWSPRAARAHLAAGRCVIAAGGIGQPCFTTDTTAALRAVEIEAELLMKASTVDGLYSADPRADPQARRIDRIDYDAAIARGLKVMDVAAFALCREHSIPIRIFDHREPGAMSRILRGEDVGSLVSKEEPHDR